MQKFRNIAELIVALGLPNHGLGTKKLEQDIMDCTKKEGYYTANGADGIEYIIYYCNNCLFVVGEPDIKIDGWGRVYYCTSCDTIVGAKPCTKEEWAVHTYNPGGD